jgi:hypothetical protein
VLPALPEAARVDVAAAVVVGALAIHLVLCPAACTPQEDVGRQYASGTTFSVRHHHCRKLSLCRVAFVATRCSCVAHLCDQRTAAAASSWCSCKSPSCSMRCYTWLDSGCCCCKWHCHAGAKLAISTHSLNVDQDAT